MFSLNLTISLKKIMYIEWSSDDMETINVTNYDPKKLLKSYVIQEQELGFTVHDYNSEYHDTMNNVLKDMLHRTKRIAYVHRKKTLEKIKRVQWIEFSDDVKSLRCVKKLSKIAAKTHGKPMLKIEISNI